MQDFITWKSGMVTNDDTAKQYQRWIGRLLTFTGGTIQELTLGEVGAFRISLKDKYSESYIEHAIALIRHYLRYENEVNDLGFPIMLLRMKEVRKNHRHVITENEYARLLQAVTNRQMIRGSIWGESKELRDQTILRVLWDTGVRRTELTDMETSRLIYKDGLPFGCWVHNKKNEASRPVFWEKSTAKLLVEYLNKRAALSPTDDHIFVKHCYGYPPSALDKSAINKILAEAIDRAGLETHIVAHSFRHAFIHRKSAKQIPDNVVAQMVGHKSPYMVMHYNKLTKPELAQAWGVEQRDLPFLRNTIVSTVASVPVVSSSSLPRVRIADHRKGIAGGPLSPFSPLG